MLVKMLSSLRDNKFIIFILLSGFFYSNLVGYNYIAKYDINKINDKSTYNTYFFEKEGGTPSFWHEAHDISEKTKDSSYFKSGHKYEFKYLPSKIVFIYYKIVGEDIKVFDKNYNQEIFKINNKKFGLIILQNFLYFISIFCLILSLKINQKNNYFIFIPLVIFLSFEPTLNQWNRVLFSESFFFSLQLMTLAILINYDYTDYMKPIMLGVLISLMYLQRSVSIYYFSIVLIYLFIFFRKKFLINLMIISLIYLSTHLFVGFHNFKRDGSLYFLPIIQKEDLYGYFVPKIIKYNKDPNFSKNFEPRHTTLSNFIKSNDLISEKDIDIKDRLIIAKNHKDKARSLIINYPTQSLKEYTKSLFHYLLLKPNEIYFLLENNIKYKGKFHLSKDFKEERSMKIVYSFFIYFISFLGLLYFIKNKSFKILFILMSSIFYFAAPVVWHTQSSYLAPILIYLSIFFSAGILNFISVFRINK